jgi:hypothetical protein
MRVFEIPALTIADLTLHRVGEHDDHGGRGDESVLMVDARVEHVYAVATDEIKQMAGEWRRRFILLHPVNGSKDLWVADQDAVEQSESANLRDRLPG